MLTFKSPPLPLADIGTQCRKITRHTQLLGPESVQHGRIPQNSSQWAQANFRFRTNADAGRPLSAVRTLLALIPRGLVDGRSSWSWPFIGYTAQQPKRSLTRFGTGEDEATAHKKASWQSHLTSNPAPGPSPVSGLCQVPGAGSLWGVALDSPQKPGR